MKQSLIKPGILQREESELRRAFLEHTKVIPGAEKIKLCLQCGTCSGSCPLSYAMDIMPRELIALFRAGDIDSVLKSRTIWICASCYTCQTRCPVGIKVTDVIYALKRTAIEKKYFTKHYPVHTLAKSFTKCIYNSGRLNESTLMIRFFLGTGLWKSISYLPLGIKMLLKGRLKFRSSKVKNIDTLRKILRKASLLELPVEKEKVMYQPDAVGYKSVG
ncbi:MAG: 4Fe-4S dicluster domain-containing protein [Ignavibacteria bacterium]